MQRHFRPEFLNRVDDTLVFHALSQSDLERIVDLQIERLRTMLTDRDLALELTPAGRRRLAELGWDPAFGARPLKRAIQRHIQDPLALALLDGRFGAGDRVLVDADPDGGLRLEPAGVASAAGAEVE